MEGAAATAGEFERALAVLRICVPVFAVIGIGKLLDRWGWMTAEHRRFLNHLIYYLSLPALLFVQIAREDPDAFADLSLLVGSLAPITVVALLFMALAKLLGYRGAFAAAFVFGSFWANVTYLGFPLARNAFGGGTEIPAQAAIYNALAMPYFVILGFLMIGLYGTDAAPEMDLPQDAPQDEPGDTPGDAPGAVGDGLRRPAPGHGEGKPSLGFGAKVFRAIVNPVVGSALLGIVAALVLAQLRGEDGGWRIPMVAVAGMRMVEGTLKLVGAMGLPLALIAIGGGLRFKSFQGRSAALALVIAGKLVLVPLLSYLLYALCYANPDPTTRGVVVLLGATPNAVASYVIACEIGVDEGFVSSMLVVSTLLSVLTIPLWLYLVL